MRRDQCTSWGVLSRFELDLQVMVRVPTRAVILHPGIAVYITRIKELWRNGPGRIKVTPLKNAHTQCTLDFTHITFSMPVETPGDPSHQDHPPSDSLIVRQSWWIVFWNGTHGWGGRRQPFESGVQQRNWGAWEHRRPRVEDLKLLSGYGRLLVSVV